MISCVDNLPNLLVPSLVTCPWWVALVRNFTRTIIIKRKLIFFFIRATLNVCLAYTSRHEISNAVKCMAEGVELGLIKSR